MSDLTLKWCDLDFEEFSKDVLRGQLLGGDVGIGNESNNGDNDGQ
jgi:hypothetical protein